MGFVVLILLGVIAKLTFFGKHFDQNRAASYMLPSTQKTGVKLTFLGTSCFIIEYNGKQYVSDPFFSNQDFVSIIKGKTPLEKLNQFIPDSMFNRVSLISITHGHFDHCLDLPAFLNPNAEIIADSSVFYQMNSLIPNSVKRHELSYHPNDEWIYSKDSTFRVFTILSHHGPHFGHTVLFNDCLHDTLKEVPHYLWDWQLGSGNYSFLVDVLNRDSIVYRMAILSGNISDSEYAKINGIYKDKPCDLFTLVFWKRKLNEQQIYKGLKNTHAKVVLLNHWNNFFAKQNQPLEEIRSSKIEEVLDDFKNYQTPVYIMMPFTMVNL